MARSQASRADFEVIAESISHIVWLAGADGSTDYFNRRGTDYTGLPRQANYGWGWVEMVHPDDAERARLGWELAARTATPFELSYRIRRHDGAFLWHAFRALPVQGADGEILKWIGTADELGDAAAMRSDAARVERQTAELRTLLETTQPSVGQGFGFVEPDVLTARVDAMLAASADTRDTAKARPTSARFGDDREVADLLRPRELAVLRLVAAGHTNAEIANLLSLSLRSIEASRARLRQELDLQTRAQLVRFAYESGLVDGGA